jgi:hypothetical protein
MSHIEINLPQKEFLVQLSPMFDVQMSFKLKLEVKHNAFLVVLPMAKNLRCLRREGT